MNDVRAGKMRRSRAVLAAAAGLLVVVSACASTRDAHGATAPLADGVYLILRQGDESQIVAHDVGEAVIVDDYRHYAPDSTEPPLWLVVGETPDVPLELAEEPETRPGDDGRPFLLLRLAPEHVDTLASFTRDNHLGPVAIIIGNEVISRHKIRATITDGRVQITRCTDDACSSIYAQLIENPTW